MCAPSVGKRIRNVIDVINSAIVERGRRVEVEPVKGGCRSRLTTCWYVAWRVEVTSTYSPRRWIRRSGCQRHVAHLWTKESTRGGGDRAAKMPIKNGDMRRGKVFRGDKPIDQYIFISPVNSRQHEAAFHALGEWCKPHAQEFGY